MKEHLEKIKKRREIREETVRVGKELEKSGY